MMLADSAEVAYNHEALFVQSCEKAHRVLAMMQDSFSRHFATAANAFSVAFINTFVLPHMWTNASAMPQAAYHPHMGAERCEVLVQLLNRLLEDRWQKQLYVAEIGVGFGCTSACLLESIPHLQLTSIDPFTTPPWEQDHFANVRQRLRKYGVRSTLVQDFSDQAASVHTQALDLVFIDRDHSYEGAAADLRDWSPHVRPGGLVAGHDAAFPGVIRALSEHVSSLNVTLHFGLDNMWWYKAK
ncbi:unnamed protein product [Polarella glacialis]|uniref:Class I SAM-dependent methyltransferase n=1 Tax=Polarella glacialis TaxID=89957 RepID=A0A813D3Z3_POLGL|nr:unnamed protein product [Polarella glacialis]